MERERPNAARVAAAVATVHAHVSSKYGRTLSPAAGALAYPYLTPAGFYSQLWDWDAVYMGAALASLQPSSLPHFVGSTLNFFALATDDGHVPGCLTAKGPSTTLLHAKPVLIWGAYLAARASGDYAAFKPHAAKMSALLAYWDAGQRRDAATGLHVWYDVMESGAGE